MARLEKIIDLGDRQHTVSEISGRNIRTLLTLIKDIEALDPVDLIREVLPLVSDVSLQDLDDCPLSDLIKLWDGLVEVNPGFFELARRTGLSQIIAGKLADVQQMLYGILNEASAAFSAGDTAAPGTTV